jgi:hypothetical protein
LAFKNSIDFDLWSGFGFSGSASLFSSSILSTLLPRIRLVSGAGRAMANRKIWDEFRMSSVLWLC